MEDLGKHHRRILLIDEESKLTQPPRRPELLPFPSEGLEFFDSP